MTERVPFTGIVLGGGLSRRMGRDKSGLTLRGKTFLELQADKLRAAGAGEVLLSGGSRELPGTRRVEDVYPRRGPLGGLHACLRAARYETCVVLCVDVPLLGGEYLASLAAAQERNGAEATLLRGPEGVEPLIGAYRRELWPRVGDLIREKGAPARALLGMLHTAEVLYDGPPEGLWNCNTPEVYDKLIGAYGP